jgi:hypothetical protein
MLVLLLLLSHTWAEDDPLKKTGEEYKIVHDSVKTTTETLDQMREGLGQAYDIIKKSNLSPEEKKKWLQRVRSMSLPLGKRTKQLKRFLEYSDNVSKVFEIYGDVMDVKSQMDEAARTQGDLAGEMRALSALLDKCGGNVPILGSALQLYGQVTGKILDAIGQVSATIDTQRNQQQVGAGIYSAGETREKQEGLKKLLGDDIGNTVWAPTTPPFVYEPTGGSHPTLIWLADRKQWFKVPKGVSAVDLYKQARIGGFKPNPEKLVQMCDPERAAAAVARTKAAKEAYDLLMHLSKQLAGPEADAFSALSDKLGYPVYGWLEDEDEFLAKYTWSEDFMQKIRNAMSEVHKELVQNKAGPTTIDKYEKWLKNQGQAVSASKKPEPGKETPKEREKRIVDEYREVSLKFAKYDDQEVWRQYKSYQRTEYSALAEPLGNHKYRVAYKKYNRDEKGKEYVGLNWDLPATVAELELWTSQKKGRLPREDKTKNK